MLPGVPEAPDCSQRSHWGSLALRSAENRALETLGRQEGPPHPRWSQAGACVPARAQGGGPGGLWTEQGPAHHPRALEAEVAWGAGAGAAEQHLDCR